MQLSLFFFISSQLGRSCIGHKNKQQHPTLTKYCFHIFLAHPNLESTRNTIAPELRKFSSLFFRPKRWRKHIWALGFFFQMETSVVSLPASAVRRGLHADVSIPALLCPPLHGVQDQCSGGGTKSSTMQGTHPCYNSCLIIFIESQDCLDWKGTQRPPQPQL